MTLRSLVALAMAVGIVPTTLPAAEPAADPDDPPEAKASETEPTVLKAYVTGEITDSLVQGVITEVEGWLKDHPEIVFIVFEVDTPGGEVEATNRLANFIFQDLQSYRTIVFIPPGGFALSGGALIAVAANDIVMGTNSFLGGAAPVAVSGVQIIELGEKHQAVVREMFERYANRRGYPLVLTKALVTKDHDDILRVRFTKPDEVLFLLRADYENLNQEDRVRRVGEPEVVLRKGELLVMSEEKARDYGFIEHIADDLTELRNALRLPVGDQNVIDSKMGRLKSRFPVGQSVVDFFQSPLPRFLLIVLGSLGILVELKTFGLLIPGLAGVACFLIFFVTSLLPATGSVAGTASLVEVLVFLLGAGLVVVEFAMLPGMAVFAISGVALCAVSLVLAMVPGSAVAGEEAMTVEDAIKILVFGFGAGSIGFLALLKFLPHNPIFARRGLVTQAAIVGVPTADTEEEASARASSLIGKRGVALSMLRPAGKMETDDGELLDVVAPGELIERGTRIVVRECHDGKVVVATEDAP